MFVDPGKKLLIAHRRLFETDQTRFFVGTVDAYDAGIVLVSGYSWNRDPYSGVLAMKGELRSKLVSITSGMVIVYVLPDELDLTLLQIETDEHQNVFLSDGRSFRIDLTERKLRT